jgi:ribosomal protein S18 acetylase RimI-like enzyme
MTPEGLPSRILYFKRFRMEIDLCEAPRVPDLPPGFFWQAWQPGLIETHADVKFRSFAEEIDAIVFPNLGCRSGCVNLMREIARRPGFEPLATWLVVCGDEFCGTVQGVRDRNGLGAIQNLGVVAAYRDLGLGTALLLQALQGFRRAGLGRVFLEVTAQNDGAIRLYRRLGFRCRKTIYKPVDPGNAQPPSRLPVGTH